MKQWSKPELFVLNINETSAITADGFCQFDKTVVCIAKGNGGGQCNNCTYNPGNNKTNGSQIRGEEISNSESDSLS